MSIDNLYKKGLGLFLLCSSTSSSADTLSSDVTWSVIGRSVSISQPSFSAVGSGSFSANSATVSSGSSVTLAGSFNIQEGDTSYCPYCIIQLYTAWISPAQPGSAGFFSGIIYPGFGSQSGLILNQEFQSPPATTLLAPKVPGTYFIGLGSTLDFDYQPNVGGSFGNDSDGQPGFAPFQVTVTPISIGSNNPTRNTLITNPGFYYSTSGSFINDGTLINNNANLTHSTGIFSNNSLFSNQGAFNNTGTLTNQGIINNAGVINNQANLTNLTSGNLNIQTGGALNNIGSLTNQGTINNAGDLINQGNLINTGELNNSGLITNTGQFNLATTGQLKGSGNFYNTAQGIVEITGLDPHVIEGNVTNEGVFKVTDSSVSFTGNFSNSARYESDPSTNLFNNLSIGTDGYLVADSGDTFIITGDFNNASTQNTLWNTANADLIFTGPVSTQHTMGLAGVDLGITGTAPANNFSWNSITLSSGNMLQLIDGNSTPGAALYTSRVILPDGVNQLSSISSNYNIYFDPTLPENQYLLGTVLPFGSGNGQITPWNLVPFASDTITDSALTTNQEDFATALNQGCSAPTGSLIDRCIQLQQLSLSQQKAAVDSLTPDQVPSQMAGPVKFSSTRMDAPLARLASIRGGGGSSPLSFNFNGVQMSTSQLAQALGLNTLGGAAGDDNELFRDSPLGFFVQTRLNFGKQQNTFWDRGFNSQAQTVTVGADYRINDNLVSGLAFNYTHSATDYVDSAGHMNSDTFMGAVYGSYFLPKDFYLDWVANYGGNQYAFNRQYAYQGFNGQSNADSTGDQYSFALSSGKDVSWQEWVIGPYLRMEYLGMHIKGYQEQGGDGFDLTTSAQTNQSLISSLGTQIGYAISTSWGVITPAVRVEWDHQYLNDNRLIEMRLSQAAPGFGNFIVQTGDPDRDYANLGGSVSATLPNGGAGFIRYETRLGQAYVSNHIVEVGVRLSF
ncbi:hypothetical protein A1359_10615 [Methylomonas lenta]|uniref:Autotransporter domain-containing protein n=1 Tax=Methylomonas lenta TaxID=980561 RepID=A0A177N8Y6_9GAMM|nr:autotransporter outer membrane beta-barrel domain-containing protein [Methylomonas lenta]OAI14516.1 hypothetical protein A1359_10615 [Methylomonas lenta]